MNTSTATTLPIVSAGSRAASNTHLRWAVGLAVVALLLGLVLNLGWREFYTGDEGFYGVAARNMVVDGDYIVRPSYHPLGDALADRDGFAHPPFNSYLYALGLWMGGGSLGGPEIMTWLAFAAVLYFAFRLLATTDRVAAAMAVALMAASPALRAYFSMLEAEPLMTAAGVAGLYAAWRVSFVPLSTTRLVATGFCVGIAFALKLWLCGPVVLAIVAALAIRAWEQSAPVASLGRGLALLVAGALTPTMLHLALVALTHPEDLSFWVRNIYLGILTQSGISGGKFGAATVPANWVHPVWYYGAALYRDHFFLGPLLLFGSAAAWRAGPRARRLAVVLAVGIAGVAPLSLIKVKEPLYVLCCATLLYAAAALAAGALARELARGRALDRGTRWLGTLAAVGLLLAVPAAYVKGVQPENLTLPFVVVHSIVYAAALAVVWYATWLGPARAREQSSGSPYLAPTGKPATARLILERTVLGGCTLALAGSLALAFAHRVPRDAAIARLVQREVSAAPAGRLAFIASNFKSYQYYTFTTGCYWHDVDRTVSPGTLLSDPKYRHLRAFIVSPEEWNEPLNTGWRAWLLEHATDRTAELDRSLGKVTGYRVFVRRDS